VPHWQQALNGQRRDICRTWKMALRHDGLLHEMLGLLANLFPGCPSAQKAFASSGNPSLLLRTLTLVNKPNLDLPTLEVSAGLCSFTHSFLRQGFQFTFPVFSTLQCGQQTITGKSKKTQQDITFTAVLCLAAHA